MEWVFAHENPRTHIREKNGVTYLTFDALEKAGVRHGFSTRLGGVSKGHLASMNLSFHRGDTRENVLTNFQRIGDAIGFDWRKLVMSAQIHETKIREVTNENQGEGILKDTVPGIDGLITKEKALPLYTSFADCVPLMFYDPVQKAAALAHSGWRGTVAKIGEKMTRTFEKMYGSDPKDLIVVIGPSICRKCYEVSEDVIEEFGKIFSRKDLEEIAISKGKGKYMLDLWKANEKILLSAGIAPEHVQLPDLCTCCNSDKLFSHRASHGKRGNLGAFIVLE